MARMKELLIDAVERLYSQRMTTKDIADYFVIEEEDVRYILGLED